jgi:hypothetical protein
MSRDWATARLPYLLRLPDGQYGSLEIGRVALDFREEGTINRTQVRLLFDADPAENEDRRQGVAKRKENELLLATNRLIRWYRTIAKQPTVHELTKVDLSPIRFLLEPPDGERNNCEDRNYEPTIWREEEKSHSRLR